MTDIIGRWLGWVRVFFAPRAPGRHSRAYQPPALLVPPEAQRAPYRAWAPLDGEAVPIVRPHVLAQERRQQRQRRRVMVLATMGIDLGPRVIHGVEVAR